MPSARVALAAVVAAVCLACDGTDRTPAPAPSPTAPAELAPPAGGTGGSSAQPQQPAEGTQQAAASSSSRAPAQATGERQVVMMDACDPETFNAVIGPGTCTRPGGGVTFETFIAQLTRHRAAAAWRFAPWTTTVRDGVTFVAVNRGGEAHTFTKVSQFGGGIVPDLNQLSGFTTVAPECTMLAPGDFVPPGGSIRDQVDGSGTVRYQCCLHPWMKLEARVAD
ncbi:MAG TPA: hypothetical protein VF198_10475 [Vicinamibacterales bacterium]